jgi:hypothetical protein
MSPYRRPALLLVTTVLLAAAVGLTAASCGGSGSAGPGADGAVPDQDAAVPPGTDGGNGSPDSGAIDAPAAEDAPPPNTGWDGGFAGPLTCAGPGNYAHNGDKCGTERWSIKTGTDPGAPAVSLLPQLTTVANLVALPMPGTLPTTTRYSPTETTAFALQDASLLFIRLEIDPTAHTDSDYHLVVRDAAGHTIITEIPYPPCVNGGPWACNISRARAVVDAQFPNLQPDVGHMENVFVSMVGVGFFDPEHGQYGVAPNNLELHAVLAICFGKGCDPTKT